MSPVHKPLNAVKLTETRVPFANADGLLIDDAALNFIVGTGQLSATSFKAGTLTLSAGSITDSGGTISFDNENLTTTGIGTFGEVNIGNVGSTGTLFSVGRDSTLPIIRRGELPIAEDELNQMIAIRARPANIPAQFLWPALKDIRQKYWGE